MERALRILGVSLLAVLVSAALAVSAASAHNFHSEAETTILQGTAVSSFENSVNTTQIKCAKASFQGTVAGTSVTQIRIHPVYENCLTTKNEKVVEIFTIGCDYIWQGKTSEKGHGQFSIECEAGKKIEYKIGTLCTAKFGPQIAAEGVHYTNAGEKSGRDFAAALTASGLVYEQTGAFCATYFGNGKDGTLTGTYTTKGFKDLGGSAGEQVGVWVE
jgi:hypothetical protein